MVILRKVLRVLQENPAATDTELAVKVFGVATIEHGQLTVPEENRRAIEEALKRLTEVPDGSRKQ